MIEKLSMKTAMYLARNLDNTTEISKIVQIHKKREELTILTKDEVIENYDYVLKAIYGEITKLFIVFVIAYFLNIFEPTLIVSIIFSSLRLFAGGAHMSTFNKCLFVTSTLFIGTGLIVDKMYMFINKFLLICITLIVSLICSIKWSPRDNINKEITDIKDIMKFKKLTILYILASTIIMLFISDKMIIMATTSAILLEIFTITPFGVKLFSKID